MGEREMRKIWFELRMMIYNNLIYWAFKICPEEKEKVRIGKFILEWSVKK